MAKKEASSIVANLVNADPVVCAIITLGLVCCYAMYCMSKNNKN